MALVVGRFVVLDHVEVVLRVSDVVGENHADPAIDRRPRQRRELAEHVVGGGDAGLQRLAVAGHGRPVGLFGIEGPDHRIPERLQYLPQIQMVAVSLPYGGVVVEVHEPREGRLPAGVDDLRAGAVISGRRLGTPDGDYPVALYDHRPVEDHIVLFVHGHDGSVLDDDPIGHYLLAFAVGVSRSRVSRWDGAVGAGSISSFRLPAHGTGCRPQLLGEQGIRVLDPLAQDGSGPAGIDDLRNPEGLRRPEW